MQGNSEQIPVTLSSIILLAKTPEVRQHISQDMTVDKLGNFLGVSKPFLSVPAYAYEHHFYRPAAVQSHFIDK